MCGKYGKPGEREFGCAPGVPIGGLRRHIVGIVVTSFSSRTDGVMRKNNRRLTYASLVTLLGVAVSSLSCTGIVNSQHMGSIDVGTTVRVRTNGEISVTEADGRVFSGTVAQAAINSDGLIEVPKGSDVELIVRRISNTELALDLESLKVNGSRYAVEHDRHYAFGLLGIILGVIAGGDEGTTAGSAFGIGAQVSTQGRTINVPDESLLTFRLAQPLRAGITDNGFTNNGIHYHPLGEDEDYARRQKPGQYRSGFGGISVRADKWVSWNGPSDSVVNMQIDDGTPVYFGTGSSGTQGAPWMAEGHVYTFILEDATGNEIARDQLDLRKQQFRKQR
jgi:hypothetical protein